MINENRGMSPIIAMILLLAFLFAFFFVFSSVFSTNTVHVTDETPIEEFDGDYTTQEELTRTQLGTISKLSSDGETEVGPVIGYYGHYEYNGVIYTVDTISYLEK